MKQFLVFLFLLCTACVSAQDVIVKKDGSTVVCRIVELTSTEITYKKWSDLDGSNYVMNRADASTINYQNGKKVDLSEVTNLYQPNNQNDGVQQYNDRALMRIDAIASNFSNPKTKAMKTLGWIGTGVALAGGVGILLSIKDFDDGERTFGQVCIGVAAAGTATAITGFLLASHYKRQYEIQNLSIYEHEFNLYRNCPVIGSVDILRDNCTGEKSLGLGLRYNF